jgi:hypothetical protein
MIAANLSRLAGMRRPSCRAPAMRYSLGRSADKGTLLMRIVQAGGMRLAISTAMMPPSERPARMKGSVVSICCISR